MISLKNINKSFGNNKILADASFHISRGELVSIMGRSGSGKTTLLNIIGLLDDPDTGDYYFNDELVSNISDTRRTIFRRDKIGFVFQDYELIKEKNVYDNIALPLMCRRMNKKKIKEKVNETAENIGIEHLLEKYPYELSGGEAQRVAIARAIIREPEIILADEPTGALDQLSEMEILNIFKALNDAGVSILIVTHNSKVAEICQKIYTIKKGKIVSC